MQPLLIGVAGGSGSGKTFFVNALVQNLGSHACTVIYQDDFYIDQSARFDFAGGAVNFDHPSSLDFELLAQCLQALKSGRSTEIPTYDFKTHSRTSKTVTVQPRPIILVDGILIFHSEAVRALFDNLVYFDTAEDLRFARRLERDVKERGRTPDCVRKQFELQVKPMHDQFVEPSKAYADCVVADGGDFEAVLEKYIEILGSGETSPEGAETPLISSSTVGISTPSEKYSDSRK